MGVNPSYFAPMGEGKDAVVGLETSSHPVEMVSWNDAAEFCARLSKREELKPFYFRAGETITSLDGTGYCPRTLNRACDRPSSKYHLRRASSCVVLGDFRY